MVVRSQKARQREEVKKTLNITTCALVGEPIGIYFGTSNSQHALIAFILPTTQGTPIYTPLRFCAPQGQLDECS